MKYAIIQTGGKQYKIKEGDTIAIEKIKGADNEEIDLHNVLMVFDEPWNASTVGTPIIEKAKVKARVIKQAKAKKVTVVKFKPKIRYHKKYGHRQPYSQVKVISIENIS